jgi:Zn-dependent protease
MNSTHWLTQIAIWAIPILFAITVHEVAHGWVASKFGDKTALMMGRLTLNPLKHIDLVGTIIVPAILLFLGGFIFGWAKPVPVNWQNLRNPRRDMAIVAMAGPAANLLMALLWAMLAKLGLIWGVHPSPIALGLVLMGQAGIMINLVLMVLNAIPIPPLDGSRVISSLLPPRVAYQFNKLEPWGFFILLALLATGLLSYVLLPAVNYLRQLFLLWFGLM